MRIDIVHSWYGISAILTILHAVMGDDNLENDPLEVVLQTFSQTLDIKDVILFDIPYQARYNNLSMGSVAFLGDLEISERLNHLSGALDMSSTKKVMVVVMKEINNIDLENKTHNSYWLVPPWTNPRMLPLRFDSLVFSYNIKNESTVTITEMYAVKDIVYFREPVADVDTETGLVQYAKASSIWDRRTDMKSIILVNTYLPYATFNLPVTTEEGKTHYVGFMSDVVHGLETVLNFQTKWVKPKDGSWGKPGKDGQWNGIVRDLIDHEADFSSGGLFMSADRAKHIDYAVGLMEVMNSLTMGLSKQRQTINILAYINIYDEVTWLIFFSLTACLILSWWCLRKTGVDRLHNLEDHEVFGITNAMAVVSVAMIQREYYLATRSTTAKILFTVTGLFAFFMFACYSAVLTSLMTAAAPSLQLRSFADVLNLGLKVFVWKNSAPAQFMSEAEEGTAQNKVYKDMKKRGHSSIANGQEEIEERLYNYPDYAYYGATTAFLKNPKLKVFKIQESKLSQVSIVLGKDSEFLKPFNYHLMKFRESGMLSLLYKHNIGVGAAKQDFKVMRWLKCSVFLALILPFFQKNQATPLGFNNLFFPVFILCIGVLAAGTTVLAERVLKSSRFIMLFKKRQQQKNMH